MPNLLLTSIFPSSITIGDPSVLTFTLAPRENKTLEVTEVQLRQLTPGLEKLKQAGWINYVVALTESKPSASAPAPTKEATSEEKTPPEPAPVTNSVVEAPVETKSEAVEEKPTSSIEPDMKTIVPPLESLSLKHPIFERKNRHK